MEEFLKFLLEADRRQSSRLYIIKASTINEKMLTVLET